MIVYKCNAKWPISRCNRRYVKMRVSDKNKRWSIQFKRLRGGRYWWKEVE